MAINRKLEAVRFLLKVGRLVPDGPLAFDLLIL